MSSKKKKRSKIEFRYYQLPEGSPVLALLGQKWTQNYSREVDYLHFHNYLEIGFCYEGKGMMTLGEQDVRFNGREFSIIPANFPHTTVSDKGDISRWEYLFIDVKEILKHLQINPVKMKKMVERINSQVLFFSEKEQPDIAAKILEIMNIMRKAEEFYMEEVRGMLISLLMKIARLNCSENEKRTVENSGRVCGVVSKAIDYISSHYMEQIRIDDLAKICHVSEAHFRRCFLSYMDMSPLDYINLVRIQAVCENLRKSDEPVSDIAQKCGFTISSTFNRNFRQITGTTPMKWRKRPQNYEQQLLHSDIRAVEGW